MSTLNDHQVADLLDEVASAIEHQVSVTNALGRVSQHQYGSMAKVAKTLITGLQQGASLETSFQKLRLADEGQITAAIRATVQTGNPDLLFSFAETLRLRHEAKHRVKLNWFYPCILTVLAYVLFVKSLAPLVRDNRMLITQWPDTIVSASVWIEKSWWAPPCIATAILASGILLFSKCKGFPTALSQSLFYSTLASQLDSNVPESEAIHTAALMSGDVELLKTPHPTFMTPRLLQLMGSEGELFRTPPQDASGTIAPTKNNENISISAMIGIRAQLRHLAYTHKLKAHRRERLFNQILPQVVSFALGFIFIFSAALLFIAPIYGQIIQW